MGRKSTSILEELSRSDPLPSLPLTFRFHSLSVSPGNLLSNDPSESSSAILVHFDAFNSDCSTLFLPNHRTVTRL